MKLEGASRQGQYVYTVVVINNPTQTDRPFRTPIVIEVPADTKLPVAGASVEGDLLLSWYAAASEDAKVAYMTDPVVTAPPATDPTPARPRVSKLGIKRALDELGLWETAKAAIASDPAVQEEWDLAVEIYRDDPLTQRVVTALGLTEEQVTSLIIRANELVA